MLIDRIDALIALLMEEPTTMTTPGEIPPIILASEASLRYCSSTLASSCVEVGADASTDERGDAGDAELGESTVGLELFRSYLKTENTKGTFAIFLGDNIYPIGMPPKSDAGRALAQHRLDAQVESLTEFEGKAIFIPGNHDWYNEGLTGLNQEQDYLREITQNEDIFLPKDGCPLLSYDINDEVHMIILVARPDL